MGKERMLCGDQEWIWVKAAGGSNSQKSNQKVKKEVEEDPANKTNSNEEYSESTPRQLAQFHLTVTAKLRLSTLIAFLVQRISKGERVVVFMGTCASVDYHHQLFESSESLWDDDTNNKGNNNKSNF